MKYTKIQKFISSFIIFSLLFGTTFRVPFFQFSTFAGSSDFFNLVSIIVDEDSYNQVGSEINRYAKDIQGVLENTKVVILPTPKNTKAFNIASLNESLYFEGYKSIDDSVDFESKLIGTVLIGDFNLPVVFEGNESSQTILPFTDFEDKSYIYNHEKNKYEVNEANASEIKSEIWHGVISPNLGDFNENINGLKDYFDKNHDYYSGTGNFKFSEGILNGNKNIGVSSNYEPYVFYNDQIREEKSLNYNSFHSYEGYIENLEDIVYNRFSQELANKISDKTLGTAKESIFSKAENIASLNESLGEDSLFPLFNSDFVSTLISSGPDTYNLNDIQTRQIIENATKKFIEIFSSGTFGEFRKDVYNAGRYNSEGGKVNMDLIPSLISVLDVVYGEIIKDVSNELEEEIDSLVMNGLSKNLAVPSKIIVKGSCGDNRTYQNFLYGKNVANISSASECSIYRGSTINSGKLVEANRGSNINLLEPDKVVVIDQERCESYMTPKTAYNGWWGGNTPFNIEKNDSVQGMIELKNNDLNGSIVPLFDIGGSTEILDSNKIPSPLDCFDDNFILAQQIEYVAPRERCEVVFSLPTFGERKNWYCTSDNNDEYFTYLNPYLSNINVVPDVYSLEGVFDHMSSYDLEKCEKNYVYLDNEIVLANEYEEEIFNTFPPTYECSGYEEDRWKGDRYYYKKVSSYVFHKSPTEEELKTEISNMTTPSLPVDKTRYVDFVSPLGNLITIDYPYLFGIENTNNENITFDSISEKLDTLLNEKSAEINNIISSNNPSSLSGNNLTIYNLLKTGDYPNQNIDLKNYLQNKESTTLNSILGTEKMSQYDTIVFALYWYNLNTVSSKYAFVFDYFLNDQLENTDQKYFLPENKKQYEIAYIGAEGDAENMYIKMDPEGKADNVYADLISDNMNLSSSLLGSNIGPLDGSEDEEALFECAPPDGVPIWEWMPAVMCRLGEMLPPTISFSSSKCSGSTIMYLTDEDEMTSWGEGDVYTCEGDFDRNGINDCIEQGLLDGGILELKTTGEKYYYNSNIDLFVNIKDKDGKIVRDINGTYVYFELQKIENKDGEKIYDITDETYNDESIISNYVNFSNSKIKFNNGGANYSIGTKHKEVNIYLKTIIKRKNELGEEENFIESEQLKIEVRGDRLFNTSYKLKNIDDGLSIQSGVSSLNVSDQDNIVIVDGNRNSINDISNVINNSSTSNEKIVLFINNLSTSGENLPISYPLNVTILEGNKEIDNLSITKADLNIFKSIIALKKSGSYTIEIVDNDGFKTIKNIELLPGDPSYLDLNLGTTIMQTGGNISTNFVAIYDEYSNLTTGTFYDINIEIDGNGIELVGDNPNNITSSTYEGYKIFRLKSTDEGGNNNINIKIFDLENNEIISTTKSIEIIDDVKLVVKPLSGNIKVGGGTYKYEVSLRNSLGEILDGFNSRVYLNANPIFLSPLKPYVVLENGVAEIEFKTNTVAGKNIPIEFQIEGLSKIIKKEITVYPEEPLKIDLILSKNKMEALAEEYSVLDVELKDRYNNLVFNDNSTNTQLEILDQFSYIITSDKTSSTVYGGKTSYKIYGTQTPGLAYLKISTNPSLELNSFLVEDENGYVNISGVGENVAKIETFYFWNKEKIEDKKYNSIYTTLLGSNYGDITQENYLAGSLLFEKGNRALAVTSLITNPYKYSNILKLDKNGLLNIVSSGEDLSQDINISTKYIDKKLAFDIYNKSLNIYIGEVFYNFDDNTKLVKCETTFDECIDKDETSINLKSYNENYSVLLENNKLLLIDSNGDSLFEIESDGTISRTGFVELEYNESNNNENLLIDVKKNGLIIAKLGLNFVDSITNISRNVDIFNSKINSIKNSILVYIRTNSYGTYDYGDIYNKAKIIYYNDPFASENTLNTFSKNNFYGYENFINRSGIGWKDGNKSLLAFSAGKTVGESVKDYMSFGVINLGDPVISLKKIKNQLPKTNIDRKFDATIGKLLSTDTNISGYHVFDYDNDQKKDILLVKSNNYLKLLEQKDVDGKFVDKGNLAYISDLGDFDLLGTGDFTGDGYFDIFFVNKNGIPFLLNNVNKDFSRYSLEKNFDLEGFIQIAKVFDMDNDGKDDIVTLDDFGEINIFYGGGTNISPNFTKQTLSTNNGIKLNSKPRNDNSLIYFDSLYQPTEISSENDRMNNLLFIKYPYEQEKTQITYEGIVSGKQQITDEMPSKYFLKTEYSKGLGIIVEKTFTDINGGFLASSDIIKTNILLRNNTNNRIENIVFGEKVPDEFYFKKQSVSGSSDVNIRDGMVGYHFIADDFYLDPGESINISYESKVKPFKHLYLDVGLFEHNEIGDDLYGDIIVKKDKTNCGDTVDIFRSLESRIYENGTKIPTCDAEKIEMPEGLIDENGNGIPDYIEELTNFDDTTKAEEYADEQLNELKTDNNDVGSVIDELTESLKDVNNYIEGLTCGFGSEGCIATPLNRAPLAPGNDPVYQGELIGDGLNIDEGIPVFSALTWKMYGPVCGPSVWPISPLDVGCSGKGAGGTLGVDNITNFVRIFVTPTLTGAVGTAICFGAPASIVGKSIPEGVSPLTPGGNCIVLAKSMDFCSGDGSDGDPESIGIPTFVGDGNGNSEFGIINGNCSDAQEKKIELKQEVGEDYLENLFSGGDFSFDDSMFGESILDSLFEDLDGLFFNVSVNKNSGKDGNYEDILKISMTRISSFPSWLMDWVTRQIEEIANKLTDFPTIFIILPDFTGILDLKWGEKGSIDTDAFTIDENLNSVEALKSNAKKVNTGIKEAYEFIGSMPLVYIEQEPVDIVLPWISEAELNKTIASLKATVKQRTDEIERAKNEWSLGYKCKYDDPVLQQECEEENALSQRVSLEFITNFDNLLNSLNTNLETLKEYKTIPEQVGKLISAKEVYLEQILCNIESISDILGGRIGKNGERFQAWVETYILIKAILKSWQALIDVFIEYEEECHDCKNERQDGLEEEFSLIDAIVPSIPIIRFPKWPDIILDLHNIRAGLRIPLPQYNISTKPIIIPTLPNLHLPTVPSASLSIDINLPEIPILPPIEISSLPDIPSLPSIELPDLPPPPKLPEILSEISVVVEIIDLITEAMCILKSSPFVPEWRAGDQIAFLTERGGYLSSDSIEVSFPEFSFPSVDAIKVSTFVNLEFEADFIVELAKQIAMPLNSFSNDFVNIFDIKMADLDFRNYTPDSISLDAEVGYNKQKKIKEIFVNRVAVNLLHLYSQINTRKSNTVNSIKFKELINKSLASKNITSNPKLDDVRKIWQEANSYTYSKEKELVEELKNNNREKFRAVSDIINTEIIKNKDLKKKINNSYFGGTINKVSYTDTTKTDLYNDTLNVYNNNFIDSAKKIINSDVSYNDELIDLKDELLSKIKSPENKFRDNISNDKSSKLLANNNISGQPVNEVTTCQQQASSDYKYTYEGIYILEEGKSYRLFDYLDELYGEETTSPVDIDNDGDIDILYFTNGQLFIKENLNIKESSTYVSTNPLLVTANDNKFYNTENYYEAINNAREAGDTNGRISLIFSSPTNNLISNFRIGLYKIVDKYLNENNENYNPDNINKDIIDAVVGIDNVTLIEKTGLFIKRKNLAHINAVGDLRNAKLKTKELIDIGFDLANNQIVNISVGTKLYAGGDSFTINYIEQDDNNDIEKSLSVSANENIELEKSIKIVGLSGNAYIEGQNDIIYNGTEILNHLNMVLLPGATISYDGNIITGGPSYLELKYYDDSELNIDFEETKKWELYDLGSKSSDYFVGIEKENDYYYIKINSFKDNINSTLSKQILLAPQIESDKNPPDLSLNKIRIPIYQKHTEDITSYIYEYSGVKNIKEVIIDLDLENDTDGNGNKTDDNDYESQVTIDKSLISLKLKFNEFESVFKKKIGISLIDYNDNIGYKEVLLDVYTPNPQINEYNNGLIEGSIDETLTKEPINLYRYRGGSIDKLEDINGLSKTDTDNGNYSFNIGSNKSGLTLYNSGSNIATINEVTGKINLTDYTLSTKILSSNNALNDKPFPKIIIQKNGEDIFYEYLMVQGVDKVNLVEDFENINQKGIYFMLTDKTSYNYYNIPETSDYSPGSLSVYRLTDTTKTELFTIFKDGRIDTLNFNYKLEYSDYNNYVVIKIIDSHFNKEIGRVMFVVDGEYIMK